MRIRRSIIGPIFGIVSLATLPAATPASAQTTFVGVCLGTVRMTFANDIQLLSGPTNMTSLTGSASCTTNAEVPEQKALSLTGSGTGVVTQCGAMLVNGAFSAVFNPPPAPPPSNGVFTYAGTTSGGVLRLAGANPTLHGIGVLAGLAAVDCAQGGASTFNFQFVMPFADP